MYIPVRFSNIFIFEVYPIWNWNN